MKTFLIIILLGVGWATTAQIKIKKDKENKVEVDIKLNRDKKDKKDKKDEPEKTDKPEDSKTEDSGTIDNNSDDREQKAMDNDAKSEVEDLEALVKSFKRDFGPDRIVNPDNAELRLSQIEKEKIRFNELMKSAMNLVNSSGNSDDDLKSRIQVAKNDFLATYNTIKTRIDEAAETGKQNVSDEDRITEIKLEVRDNLQESLKAVHFEFSRQSKSDFYEYGLNYLEACEKVDWNALSDLVTDWNQIVNASSLDEEEKELYCYYTDYLQDLRYYQKNYDSYVTAELAPAITELLAQASEEEVLYDKWLKSKAAYSMTQGGLHVSKNNSELTHLNTTAQTNYEKITSGLPGNAVQKANYNELILFNKKIVPGSEKFTDIATTWTAGTEVSAMLYYMDAAKNNIEVHPDGIDIISLSVVLNGRENSSFYAYPPIINRTDLDKPYLFLSIFPKVEDVKGQIASYYEKFFNKLRKLEVSTTQNMELTYDNGDYYYTAAMDVKIDQAAISYFEEVYKKACYERIAGVKFPASKMTNSSISALVKEDVNTRGTYMATSIASGDWIVYKKDGITDMREVFVYGKYKDENGDCYMSQYKAYQRYIGGGKFDTVIRLRVDGGNVQMLCD